MRTPHVAVLSLVLLASCRSSPARPAASASTSPAPAAQPAETQPAGMLSVAAQPAAATRPQAVPPLGPTTAWLPEEGEWFIDLDTARTATLPDNLADSQQIRTWLAEQGVDLLWQRGPLGDSLLPIDATLQRADSRDWDNPAAQAIWNAMAQVVPAGEPAAIKLDRNQLPAVLLIKTREGGMGILQVRKTKDPAVGIGIEVQYKMLEQTETTGLASLSPAARALALRRLKETAAATEAAVVQLRTQIDVQDPRIAHLEAQLAVLRRRIAAIEQADQALREPASQPAAAE